MVLTKQALPQEVLHKQQIENCQKLKENVEIATQEAVESINKLNLKDELDVTTLFSESNVFVSNINQIIYNLRILLIHVHNEASGKQNLLGVIKRLIEIAYSVSNSCNDEPSKLQSVLKTSVQSVSIEAANLFTLVKTGDLKTYKQDYVDVLNDLLTAVDRITVRNLIINATPKDISNLLIEAADELGEAIKQVYSENEFVLSDVTHYTRRASQNMQKVVHYLHKYGQRYDEKLAKEFLHASCEMHNFLNRLQEAFQAPYNVRHMNKTIDSYAHKGCKLIAELAVYLQRNDLEDGGSIKETIYHVSCETVVNPHQLARGLRISACLN